MEGDGTWSGFHVNRCNGPVKHMRSIIFCTTCKYSTDSKTGPDGQSGGQILLDHMRALVKSAGRGDVTIEEQVCLWNCNRPCSVVIRDEARFSYVTGGHEPSLAQAEAILEWFDAHGRTDGGEVPFKQWPQRMRGHFIARLPPVQS
jgi:predicted metal-binding protein